MCRMVERSDLAPLEFLMSKQPRGNVRIGVGNTVGERVSNVFVDVKKFQQRYAEATRRTTSESSQVSVFFPFVLNSKPKPSLVGC